MWTRSCMTRGTSRWPRCGGFAPTSGAAWRISTPNWPSKAVRLSPRRPIGCQADVRMIARDEMVDVLIVETDPIDARVTLNSLQEAGLTNQIHQLTDGEQALQFLFCVGAYAHREGAA